ncbi:hypothetical protein MTO96_010013 [Rhipicephalus appendiculatus]
MSWFVPIVARSPSVAAHAAKWQGVPPLYRLHLPVCVETAGWACPEIRSHVCARSPSGWKGRSASPPPVRLGTAPRRAARGAVACFSSQGSMPPRAGNNPSPSPLGAERGAAEGRDVAPATTVLGGNVLAAAVSFPAAVYSLLPVFGDRWMHASGERPAAFLFAHCRQAVLSAAVVLPFAPVPRVSDIAAPDRVLSRAPLHTDCRFRGGLAVKYSVIIY